MSDDKSTNGRGTGGKRLGLILLAVAAMVALVVTVGESLRSPSHGAGHLGVLEQVQAASVSRAPAPGHDPNMIAASGTRRRNLADYYALRAYYGAPPAVPHAVEPEFDRNQRCNVCHLKGGFVEKFNAYAPLTPHPEYANCLQCHAQSSAEGQFVEIDWRSPAPPVLSRPALPGNPPPVPHPLFLRGSCLSCHAGPAAVAEVRTGHPERLNCLQCHVPRKVETVFGRERAAQ